MLKSNGDHPENQERWRRHAASLRNRLRVGWWLDGFLPAGMFIAACFSVVFWLIRSELLDFSMHHAWMVMSFALVVAAVLALRSSLRHRISHHDALLRLDVALQLHHQLPAAFSGFASWPEPPLKISHDLQWNLKRISLPIAISAACCMMAFWLPLPKPRHAALLPEELPLWGQLDKQLENLREEKVIDPSALAKNQEMLDQLRSQDPDDWFSHESLEATDALAEMQKKQTDSLLKNFEQTQRAMEQFEQSSTSINQARRDQLDQEFSEQVEALSQLEMKPDHELLEKLKAAAEMKPSELTAEQREAIDEALSNAQSSIKDAVGELSNEFFESHDTTAEGTCAPQSGGVERGPGHDPNLFGKASDALSLTEFSAIPLAADAAIGLGDQLSIEKRSHELDASNALSSDGGAIQNLGQGGDRTWHESLDPAEQNLLKHYFE